MSVHTSYVEDVPQGSNILQHEMMIICESDHSCSTSSPGGNLVDGLPPAAHNGGWEDCWLLKAKLCVAREAFFCHARRIHMSEFDEGLKEPSLGIKERSYVIGMFVIIMSAEICC